MALTQEITDCLKAIQTCEELCRACADECERVGGMELCVDLCRDSADQCNQHGARLAKNDHSRAETCIAASEACAVECEKHAQHVDLCAQCAEACQLCAEECRDLEQRQGQGHQSGHGCH